MLEFKPSAQLVFGADSPTYIHEFTVVRKLVHGQWVDVKVYETGLFRSEDYESSRTWDWGGQLVRLRAGDS